MKKVLFGINSLHIGGIQTALINLLQVLDYSKYDVTVQLFHYEEEYLDLIPKSVKVKKAPYLVALANNTMKEAKEKGTVSFILRGMMAILCKIIGANHFYTLLLRRMNDNTYYDEAVSFTNNGNIKSLYFGMNQYILNHVKAKNKSTWLHVDFESMMLNNEYNIREYRKFDKVIAVSEAAKEVFLRYVSDMREKTFVVYNVIDCDAIKRKGYKKLDCPVARVTDGLNLVTVCRLDKNKNVIACLEVAQKLKSLSVVFRWIIVGDGTEREYIATQIADRKLEDVIVLTGYQRNPYPYIMNSDVMISTSLSESYGMAVAESVLLHVPAIAFSYPALTEVIDQGKNGFIIDQGNIDGMVEIIKALHDDRKKLKRLKEDCYCKVTVQDAMRQFNSVFNGEDK